MSKAFTALGILYLEQEGKLSLTDDLRQYIPWLSLRYEGQYKGSVIEGDVPVTIANALYQTTGIPFESIGELPEGTSDHALEDTVRTLIGTELDFYPGTRYSYATINYDILGFIIEIVSGESYEAFLEKTILSPLGLTHTYARFGSMQENSELAVGYKREGLSAKRYDAPSYRGNTPAGYIVSTAEDMARWMQIQMGMIQVEEPYASLIEKSHMGNASVASTDGYLYGAGWSVQDVYKRQAMLDPLKDSRIYENFNKLIGNKTAVYISHRMSSSRFCDKIAYIEDGIVKEYGSHEELMRLDRLYATMFKKQAKLFGEI